MTWVSIFSSPLVIWFRRLWLWMTDYSSQSSRHSRYDAVIFFLFWLIEATPEMAKDACNCEYTMVACALVSNHVITCSCPTNIVNSYQFQCLFENIFLILLSTSPMRLLKSKLCENTEDCTFPPLFLFPSNWKLKAAPTLFSHLWRKWLKEHQMI